jgi:signal transduction histidine kinase
VAADAAQLLADWTRFLSGLPPDSALPRVVLESWTRCRDARVDPRPERQTFRRVSPEDLERRLKANGELLEIARPHAEWLTALLGQVPHVVSVVDRDGVVLASTGTAPAPREACGRLPGYDWSEVAMGTNGAGTALAADQPVAIVGPRHFCQVWHDATCVAAPIHGPDGGVIGALDLTTSVADGSPERLAVVAHIAHTVGQDLARRHARQDTGRVRRLAEASLGINSTLSLRDLVQVITEQARELIGAHMAVTGQTVSENWAQMIDCVSLSDKYAAWRTYAEKPDGSGIYAEVCRLNRPMRLTQAELEAHPAWRDFGQAAGRHPPLRGWLAAPLIAHDGANLGLIQVSDKYEGDFTEEDEAVLVQLAQMASVAIENARLLDELAGERSRLVAVLEQMPAGVMLAEAPSGRLLLANERVQGILRHHLGPAGAVEEYGASRAFHPDGRPYRPEDYPLARAVRSGEVVVNEEMTYLRGDGTCCILSANAAPIRDANGRVVAGVVTFQDITERRRFETLLAEEARLVEAIVTGAPLSDILTALARFIEEQSGEALCSIVLFDADRACLRHGAAPSLPAGYTSRIDGLGIGPRAGSCGTATYRRETVVVTDIAEDPLWERWRDVALAHGLRACWSSPIFGNTGEVLGTFAVYYRTPRAPAERDTELVEVLIRLAAIAIERGRAEAERAQLFAREQAARAEAEAAARARDAFLARASHELRTPLTSALGTVRLLKRALAGVIQASPHELTDIANRNLDMMLDLLNNLLDASKLHAGVDDLTVQPVEAQAIIGRSLDVVSPQARERDVELRVEVPRDLRVPADPLKLEQVLVNLLANAVKFTPRGGRVTVEAASEAGAIVVRVRDTGEGIPREHLERIFEPFFQAGRHGRQRPRGTGLGLAICRQIVQLHGGRIWAESEGPGQGASFVIMLPGGRAGQRVA